jgi:hypothetical protein
MSIPKLALGALIAFGVSVICLLPPGVHFITGPIGPFIGGYVAGNRIRLNEGESALVGLIMGLALGGSLVLAFEYLVFLPNLSMSAVVPLSVVAALYVGVLGALGAWLAGGRTRGS